MSSCLNGLKERAVYPPVRLLTKIYAVAALLIFGLASEHCRLEALPAFGFLQFCCSSEGQTSPSAACEDEVCRVLESGAYRAEDLTVSCPEPIVSVALVLISSLELQDASRAGPPRDAIVPPDLAPSWRFISRVAAPPRAPSHLS